MSGQNARGDSFRREEFQNAFQPGYQALNFTEEEFAQINALFENDNMGEGQQHDTQMSDAPAVGQEEQCMWCGRFNGLHNEDCILLDDSFQQGAMSKLYVQPQQMQIQTPAAQNATPAQQATPFLALPKLEPRDSVQFQSPENAHSPSPAPRAPYQAFRPAAEVASAYAPAAPQPEFRDPWQNGGRRPAHRREAPDSCEIVGSYYPASPYFNPEPTAEHGHGLEQAQAYTEAGIGLQQTPKFQHPTYPGMPGGGQQVARGYQAQNRLDPKHLQHERDAHQQAYPAFQRAHGLPMPPPPPPQQVGTAPPAPPYRALHPTMDAAQLHLHPPAPTDPLVPVAPPSDDTTQVLSNLHVHASTLFAALSHPPGPPPQTFTPEDGAYYTSHQLTTHAQILAHLTASPAESEARVLMLLHHLTSLHTSGVPSQILSRKTHRQGYIFEHHGVCSERFGIILDAVKRDKYVATDVLSGTGVEDFVRSPNRYLRRKQENSRVNAKKARDKREAEEVKAGAAGMKRARDDDDEGGATKKWKGMA